MSFCRAIYPLFWYYDLLKFGTDLSAANTYIADAILGSGLNIPLRGIAIGNGWIDGRNQYPAYLEYAATHGIIDVESQQYKDIKQATDRCLVEFDGIHPDPIHIDDCEELISYILESKSRSLNGVKKCMNIYDIRLEDDFPACGMNWPPDLESVTSYLAREDVVKALHATGKSENWVECQGIVGSEMRAKFSPSSITLLPSIVERIPVLLFAGDQDYICNYMGIEKMIDSMTWGGEIGLGSAQTEPWTVAGTPAGTWVSSRNLTYAKIFNASHMVPYDVPDVAHDMILRFMGVDFSAILEGSARIPSSVGDDVKPIFMDDENLPVSSKPPGKSPEQTKAQWDAYYNAGTAALVFLLVVIGLGVCMWYRLRRRRIRFSRRDDDAEENIPLKTTSEGDGDGVEFEQVLQNRKGKERAIEDEGTPIFDVGEADED
ncbi:Alpha/Beta hydrolase protein [Lanmaoa asiatica]|nr:Alpha/Beta hydrolase protein [Lanmaoa asiatica]